MKTLKFVVAAMLVVIIAACSTDKYDAAECERLTQKIDKKETLTEDEYETMLTQLIEATKFVKEKLDATKGSRDKEEELRDNQDFTKAVGHVIMFDFYLNKHRLQMSEESREKLEEIRKSIMELRL